MADVEGPEFEEVARDRLSLLIQGAGAVGSLLAARLAVAGVDVTLLERNATRRERLTQDGLLWIDGFGAHHVLKVPVLAAECPGDRRFDLLLCCVKSWAVASALEQGRRFLGERGLVMVVSNGLGNLEIAESLWDPGRCLVGTNTYGATRLGQTGVRSQGEGILTVACRPQASAAWAQLPGLAQHLRRGLEIVVSTDAAATIWHKAAVNCAINPVAALLGVPNGALLESPAYGLAEAIVREVTSVARAHGVNLADDVVLQSLRHVCESTRDNRCSMLVDLEMGRETEISSLCEEVVRRAHACGLDAAANAAMAQLIRARERLCRSS